MSLLDQRVAWHRAVEVYLAALRPGSPGLPPQGEDGEWPTWSCGCLVNGSGAHWVTCRGVVAIGAGEPLAIEQGVAA